MPHHEQRPVEADVLGDPQPERAGSEDVLHRLAEAEIGGQRQRRHELGEPDLRWIGQPLHAWHEHSPQRLVSQAPPGRCSMMSSDMDVLQFVTAHLPSTASRVLEVGCGGGRLARALDDLGHRVVAIDPAAPEGAIFQAVSLEEFADPVRFDAIVAIRALHHIHDLAGALSKLQGLLVPGGRLILVEHAFDRLDEPTARWYLEKRRATDPGAPDSLQGCLAEWEADHAGLHGYTAMGRELDRRFTERWFAWTPALYLELGQALECEELSLIEAGSIQATGFEYVGERRGG
jgi:SAM-dependent methyltransferase